MRNSDRQTANKAVRYVRMSTEHQRYSLENQAAAISSYATVSGLQIVRSYEDSGKSGLTLKKRPGLQHLLADCVQLGRDFSAILVLDVSRWGRFQDIDEAAHYEFICRQAGVRVIYCGEPFEDDGTPISSVFKHLKRVMAAEFSRELSAKLVRARLQQARLGFRQGGVLTYGFRRLLVSADGAPRQLLDTGTLKAVHDDRVRIVPGPEAELDVIRKVFRLYVAPGGSFAGVARRLNEEGIPTGSGRPWDEARIGRLIRNELAVGQYTFNKTGSRLAGPSVRNPESEWVRVRVCDPIVEPAVFRRAQRLAAHGGRKRFTDEQMLDGIKRLLEREARLSPALIDAARGMPRAQAYADHFGSLARAYDLIGYRRSPHKWRKTLGGYWTDEAILAAVRTLHSEHGYVACSMLKSAAGTPSYPLIRRRFGSLRRCYELAGLPHDMSALQQAAQLRRRRRLCGDGTPTDMLDGLRLVWERHGRLSTGLINRSPETWSTSSYCRAFGSLSRAYELIGYTRPRYFNARDEGRHTSDAFLLEGLRRLIKTHGYVDGPMVDADPALPTQWVYRNRFGGMLNAYRLAGWNVSRGDLTELGKLRKQGSHDPHPARFVADCAQ